MPELPEVEVTRCGLAPQLTGRRVVGVRVRNPALRWPVPARLPEVLQGATFRDVARRGKYLLFDCGAGWLIVHLGMSGSLRISDCATPPAKHDHVDIELDDGRCMRLRDPRRFGAVLWVEDDPRRHPLLSGIGPEPLADDFSGETLWRATRGRGIPIKQALLDGRLVAGVGNIYANEALFQAGIDPRAPAGRIGRVRYADLAEAVRAILRRAIEAGGSSLRDFADSAGNPGYFQQEYAVYGRDGQPCRACGAPIRRVRQGQRATFYCPDCQRR